MHVFSQLFFCAVLVVLALIGPVQAQSAPWSVGLRTGLTVAGVSRSAIKSYAGVALSDITSQSVNTYHIGVIANRRLSRLFSIQSEMLYNRYGGEIAGSYDLRGFSGRVDVRVKISTVELPVLLKATVGKGRIRYFINGGGFITYSVNSEVTTEPNISSTLFPDLTHKFLYGAVLGAGLSIGLGPGRVLVEGRYNYTLGDNLNLDFGGGDIHYQIASGSIGYLIPL